MIDMGNTNYYEAPYVELLSFSFEENIATSPTSASEGIDDMNSWSGWE
jgi:hypothetical protein